MLADGRTVRTSADGLPDLFRALRGGGGNVGIVTEFAAVPAGPPAPFGMSLFHLDDGAAVPRPARDLLPGCRTRTPTTSATGSSPGRPQGCSSSAPRGSARPRTPSACPGAGAASTSTR